MSTKPLSEILDAVREGRSAELEINVSSLNGEDLQNIARTVRSAPQLNKLVIGQGQINDAACGLLAEAISHRNDIQEFGFIGVPASGEGCAVIAEALAHNKDLKILRFPTCRLGSEAVTAFAGLIDKLDDFRELFLTQGTWDQASHDTLSNALIKHKNLITINTMGHVGYTLDDSILEQNLLAQPQQNLLSMYGTSSDVLKGKIKLNFERREKTHAFLRELQDKPEDRVVLSEHITPQHIIDIEAQTPALASYTPARHEGYDRFQFFYDTLPTLPEGQQPNIETLLTPDETGFTPLENPKTWQQYPDLLSTLAANHELKHENYIRQTPKGSTLLEMACAFRPVAEVTSALNASGVRIGKDALIHEDGSTTSLLHTIHSKGELRDLFSYDNWIGGERHEVDSTIQALPDNVRIAVPPLNRLKLALDRTQRSHAQIGR